VAIILLDVARPHFLDVGPDEPFCKNEKTRKNAHFWSARNTKIFADRPKIFSKLREKNLEVSLDVRGGHFGGRGTDDVRSGAQAEKTRKNALFFVLFLRVFESAKLRSSVCTPDRAIWRAWYRGAKKSKISAFGPAKTRKNICKTKRSFGSSKMLIFSFGLICLHFLHRALQIKSCAHLRKNTQKNMRFFVFFRFCKMAQLGSIPKSAPLPDIMKVAFPIAHILKRSLFLFPLRNIIFASPKVREFSCFCIWLIRPHILGIAPSK